MKKLFSLFVLTAFVVTPLLAAVSLTDGCTDPIACNYDPDSDSDDGSCVYTDNPVVDMTSTTWTLMYDWGVFGPGFTVVQYNSDRTWTDDEESNGFWSLCSDDLVHLFDNTINTEYVGMWNGTAFEGTMSNDSGQSGTFLLSPDNPVEFPADPCSDEDCPLEWSEALMDSNVECPSNLPTFCEEYYEYAGIEGLEAVNSCTGDTYEVATCFPLASQSLNLPVTTCMATTAQLNPEGNLGAVDGAVRLYNLHQTGLVDGEYFLEDPNNPLTLRYAPDSKTARLTGTVYCRENANQIFHVDARFDNEQVASEWLAESPQHSLLSDDACSLDADAISVFDLAPMSRLEGDGELEGTLFIDHYPATYSARFQLGEGANNHNCNYGFGGWFRWSGTLNDVYTEGTTGDIVVDLACSAAEEACSEYAEFLFEAVDDCGRILSTTVTVTRDDTQNPVVVSGPQDMTVECDNVPPMAPGSSITATDNCEGPLTITDGLELRIDGNCPSNYTLDRRWTITDACGNSTVHTQLVTVQDTTDPVIVAEDMVEIACENWPVDTAIATASDNCGNVELTFSQMDGDLGCIEPFTTYQRTYYAEDECGNSAVKAQTLVLVDDVDPEFTSVPESYTAECTDELVLDMATAMDNCGEPDVTVSTEIIPGECDAEYTMVRTFTADDGCGNAVTATQTIDVVDSTAPTLMTVPYFEGFRGQFAAENWETTEGISVTGNALTIVGYDNVANPYDDGVIQTAIAPCLTMGGTVSFDWDYSLNDLFPSFDVGFYVNGELMMQLNETNSYEGSGSIMFECNGGDVIGFGVDATDGCCGSATLVIDNFEVLGSEEPQALPSDLSFECDEVDQIPAAVTLYAMGNCSLAEVAFDESTVAGDCPQDYDIVRTWTASDECGNETIHTQTIQVRDTEAPEFTYVPADYTVQCAEDVVLEDATATDNCGEVSIAYQTEIVNQTCPNKYQLIRAISATDECGNITIAQQTITVDDTMAPEFTFVPEDYTVQCAEDVVLEDATATDNCGELTIDYSVDTVNQSCPNKYQLIRTWVATDECDNSMTVQQTITVDDTMAPEFTFVPEDYTVQCAEDVVLEDATATDNCGELTIDYSVDTVNQSCPNKYQLFRTWVATDECDNSTTVQQTITVDDTIAPEFTFVPEDYTVQCAEDVVLEDATATDNCGELTIDYSVDTVNQSCPNKYQLIRTWVATDECDNSTTAQQTITVDDTIAPEFTFVPEDYTVQCAEDVVLEDATATDNCGELTIDYSVDTVNQSCPNKYQLIRTWVATDECDNSTTAQQTITVDDTIAPEFTFVPEDYTVQCAEDVVLEDATATDNCGELTIDYSVDTVNQSCPNKYQLIRTWVATDECDNSTTVQQTITVDDTIAPEFTFVPEDYTVQCAEDVVLEDATATDNCGELTIDYSVDTVNQSCPNKYQLIRTWVATDECDNSTTVQQTITVDDTIAPEFTFVPEDYTVECSDDVTYEDAAAIDNCGELTIDYSVDTVGLECPNNFQIIRTWVATDECDNSTTAQQTITVDDSTAPEFTFVPADYTVECSDDVTFDDAEAVDNCGEVTISYALDTLGLSCPNNFQILRTIVATDDCNNSETVVQTITVEDTTAPEFVSVPADYSIECTEEPTYGDVEVMDNCSEWEVVLTTDTIESGCDNVYDIVLTWTATDACDNASSASQTISVIDTTLPQITFSCGLENGEIVDVCCEDLSGSITVPAACELEAVDFACGGDLTISLTETYEGEYTPSETVDHWCVISEPQGMDEGLTCEGLTPHAMRLFNFPGDDFYSLIDGAVSHNVDGTMTYYMTLVSQSNPDAGWELEAQFTQPLDWFEWQNQPGNHSFKNDCGLGDHMEWEYSIMTSGEAQGWGEYEGSDMTLMHQPVSGYFGFQMGEGANNKNGNYGFSGWFYCSGTFDGAPFNTSGDIFGELECCLPWTLDRAYTVADCSGNTTTFHYEVHATGAPCINEEEGGVQDGEDQTMVSYKDLIKVLDLMPNPTTGMTQVTLFTEELGTTAQVSLFNMAGQEVMPLFNGQLNAGWPMPLMFDASDLEAGMYQLRIHSKNFVTSKKLLVAH